MSELSQLHPVAQVAVIIGGVVVVVVYIRTLFR